MSKSLVLCYNHKDRTIPDTYYIVDSDCGKDFDYRGRMSSNGFFFGSGLNAKKTDGTDFIHICPAKPGFSQYDDLIKKIPNITELHIWDFYKVIGYDYKKKKYVDKVEPK